MKRFSQVGEKQDVEQYILHTTTCININVFICLRKVSLEGRTRSWKNYLHRAEMGKLEAKERRRHYVV